MMPQSDSGERKSYSRKEKSLRLLCSNFLDLYDKEGVDSIGIDDAATQLEVERRRIYDVVNILESIGVVARKQKNQYYWKGFGAIPQALKELKEAGLRENFRASCCHNLSQVLGDKKDEGDSSVKIEAQTNSSDSFKTGNEAHKSSSEISKADNKREKSLWLLSQNVAKLFLCSDQEVITLDNTARALFGESYGSTAMRTKVRRLYDITNVFSSINLIEKVPDPDSRRPAIRWLGWGKKLRCGQGGPSSQREIRKRTFGTEITNYNLKRSKDDSSTAARPCLIRHVNDISAQQSKNSAMDFVFGPFTPATKPSDGGSGNMRTGHIQDIENLASTYSPNYCNPAIIQLFDHYVEAWKSWHVEVAREERIE